MKLMKLMKHIKRWNSSLDRSMKMTRREYDASINALNIFFGAVIGITLGGALTKDVADYVIILLMSVGAVISILYISYSERKWMGVASLVVSIVCMLLINYTSSEKGEGIIFPQKLVPTLAVWSIMALITEYIPIIDIEGKPEGPED